MASYSPIVLDHFKNPRNVGEIIHPDGVGEVGNPVCGDMMTFYIKVKDDRLEDVKFQTFGCASAIASSSALTELVKGKTLEEASKITNQDIAAYLGGLPDEKMHCSVMGMEALEDAILKYKGEKKVLQPSENIICKCFDVSEEKIRKTAIENHFDIDTELIDSLRQRGQDLGGHGHPGADDGLRGDVPHRIEVLGERLLHHPLDLALELGFVKDTRSQGRPP